MALIKCNNCGKEISDKASSCIHCGKKINITNNNIKTSKKRPNFIIGFVLGCVFTLIIFIIIYMLKINIEQNKCESGYSYNDEFKICSKREQTLKDENGNCPNGYGFNEYDNTCVKYNEYRP